MRVNKDIIKAEAVAKADSLFEMAFGERGASGAAEWRPRSKERFAMHMHGGKRGVWQVFGSEEKGDILDFYARYVLKIEDTRRNFSLLLKKLAAELGLSAGEVSRPTPRQAPPAKKAAQKADAKAREQRERRKAALVQDALAWSEALSGTPAETYLDSRSLGALSTHPHVRWLPAGAVRDLPYANFGSLAIFVADETGQVTGLQRVLLDRTGQKARGVKHQKISTGHLKGSFLRLPGREQNGPVYVAEGPESALSLWYATGEESWAAVSVSGFMHLSPPPGCKLVLCPDQDAKDSQAGNTFVEAVQKLRDEGHAPVILRCPEPEGSKGDFNDTLQRLGTDYVRGFIAAGLQDSEVPVRNRAGQFVGKGPAHQAQAPTMTPTKEILVAKEARQDLNAVLAEFFENAKDPETQAQSLLIKASHGLGKSHATLTELAKHAQTGLKGDIVFYAPTYKLAEEHKETLEQLGVTAFVMRGRNAPQPGSGRMTCDQADLALKIAGAGGNVQNQLCQTCPFRGDCAYMKQWRDLPAGSVIRLHVTKVLARPKHDRGRTVALRIIDESFFGALAERDVKNWNQLQRSLQALPKSKRDPVEAALQALGVAGRSLREVDMAALEHVDLAAIAKTLERFSQGQLRGRAFGSDLAARWERELRKRAPLRFLALVFRALADCCARGVKISQRVHFSAQGPDWKLHLDRSHELPRDAPILMLDADGSERILQRFVPGAKLVSIEAKRNAEVIQVKNRVFGKGTLQRERVQKEIGALLRSECLRTTCSGERPKVLAVASKGIVEQLWKQSGGAETNGREVAWGETFLGAEWIWFGPGGLGVNRFRDYDTVIVLGREELPDSELEGKARAIFADRGHLLDFADNAVSQKRPQDDLPCEMADGSVCAVPAPARRDPFVREIQMQHREFNSRQCIERLRLVNAVTPKRVVIVSKLPIPGMPVTRHVAWEELLPSRADQAINEVRLGKGLLRVTAKGLAEDAPLTFETAKAAEIWLSRDGGRTALIPPQTVNTKIWGERGNPRRIKLRKAGSKGRWSTALVLRDGDIDCLLKEAFNEPMLWEPLETRFDACAPSGGISPEPEVRASGGEAESSNTPDAADGGAVCELHRRIVRMSPRSQIARAVVSLGSRGQTRTLHVVLISGARGPPEQHQA
ncbi:DUF7146 domain-containing protein [Salipiger sp. CCB-MM3]|uniref:DUF7146 domain-containing protein n=1 Tax=Salipiger sp. CCB-MM3 TaxID=1792508 RepID=UPI00187DB198|nr:toprim domain-containing protein [Salipiger sp. CCB-MM3]